MGNQTTFLIDDWRNVLEPKLPASFLSDILDRVNNDRAGLNVFPENEKIFNALNNTLSSKVKVVILGQDPYHGFGQAHGYAFSVPDGIKKPPSLRNIYKELESDIGLELPDSGNLSKWAQQGVLLLNSILTVREGEPASHRDFGWEQFTDEVIKTVSREKKHVVYMLWGNYAQSKSKLIDTHSNLILKSAHPSPLSAYRGFFGCKHFSQANEYLLKHQDEAVNWSAL